MGSRIIYILLTFKTPFDRKKKYIHICIKKIENLVSSGLIDNKTTSGSHVPEYIIVEKDNVFFI